MAHGHNSADVMSVIGCTVGEAVLVELIAQGGMSCIYKAHHRGDLDTFYAVKCVPCESHLPAEKEAFWAAVQREAGFLRLLSSHTRQVPQFIGAGRITSRSGATVGCIVMEFLEGGPSATASRSKAPTSCWTPSACWSPSSRPSATPTAASPAPSATGSWSTSI
jgi:serine/threonine protein kinase